MKYILKKNKCTLDCNWANNCIIQQSFFQISRFYQVQSWEQAIAKARKNAQQWEDKSSGKLSKWIIQQKHQTPNHTTSIMATTPTQNNRPFMHSCENHINRSKTPRQTFFDDTYHNRKLKPPDPKTPRGVKVAHPHFLTRSSSYGRCRKKLLRQHH